MEFDAGTAAAMSADSSNLTLVTDQPDSHLAAARRLPAWLWSNQTWCGQAWNATCNLTDSDDHAQGVNYGAVILVLIPMLTVFGNSLVVVSVIREKALRTVTNYFIVSLATSDVTNYFIVSLATSDVTNYSIVSLTMSDVTNYFIVSLATSDVTNYFIVSLAMSDVTNYFIVSLATSPTISSFPWQRLTSPTTSSSPWQRHQLFHRFPDNV